MTAGSSTWSHVASFTSDADLGLDPDRLADVPLLEEAMTAAGFARGVADRGIVAPTRAGGIHWVLTHLHGDGVPFLRLTPRSFPPK